MLGFFDTLAAFLSLPSLSEKNTTFWVIYSITILLLALGFYLLASHYYL